MEFLDIGINIPSVIPLAIVMTMLFMMMKLLECLKLMEDVDIGLLRPSTLPIKIVEFIIVVIELVMMIEVGIFLNRPSTTHLSIVEKKLMLTVYVDIGIRPATIPPITQVAVVYFHASHFLIILLTKKVMVMRE